MPLWRLLRRPVLAHSGSLSWRPASMSGGRGRAFPSGPSNEDVVRRLVASKEMWPSISCFRTLAKAAAKK